MRRSIKSRFSKTSNKNEKPSTVGSVPHLYQSAFAVSAPKNLDSTERMLTCIQPMKKSKSIGVTNKNFTVILGNHIKNNTGNN